MKPQNQMFFDMFQFNSIPRSTNSSGSEDEDQDEDGEPSEVEEYGVYIIVALMAIWMLVMICGFIKIATYDFGPRPEPPPCPNGNCVTHQDKDQDKDQSKDQNQEPELKDGPAQV